MKKKMLSLLTALILAFSMTACGASSQDADASRPMNNPSSGGGNMKNEMAYDEGISKEESSDEEVPQELPPEELVVGESGGTGALKQDSDSLTPEGLNLKLIWRANVNMETLEFDPAVESIRKEAAQLGGFVESSTSSGGANARGNYNNKSAHLTLRIPAKNLTGFLGKLEDCGTITYQNLSSENISLEYADTEARKQALKTEYNRLMELMAQAENIDTVIALEARLSDVRLELDSLSSRLRTFDNLVDYATVDINIDEVEHISNIDSPSVPERIKNGLSDTMYSLKTFLVDFVVFFIVNIPVFIVIAIVLVVVVFILKAIRKRVKKGKKPSRKEKKAAKAENSLPKPEEKSDEKANENK